MKSLPMAGQFTDRKVALEELADERLAKEVVKELGYKINQPQRAQRAQTMG